MRTILHVDLDAFYSAIEQRDHPELRGKPVVVGGDADGRGVVATASYEARRFGVHSAMPCRTARRLCPAAIFVRPRFAVYREVSRQLHDLFLAYTSLIEPIACDEAFLDVSAEVREPAEAEALARDLKLRIRRETKLTASVGLAANKLVAKVASDRQKPDGLTIVPAGQERAFLAPLPVRALFGIGPRSEGRLREAGIDTIAQLAGADPGRLVAHFGQVGLEWQRLAQGIDDRAVAARGEPQQISRERTFAQDVTDRQALHHLLDQIAQELLPAVHEAPPARTLTLKVRYADWTTITRRQTPGSVLTAESLPSGARHLLDDAWDGRPVRLLGLGVSNFIAAPTGQLSLFDP